MAVIRVARFWQESQRPAPQIPAIVAVDLDVDALSAFGSESISRPDTDDPAEVLSSVDDAAAPPARGSYVRALKAVCVAALIVATVAAGTWEYRRRYAAPVTGSVTIQTDPAGLDVEIDGRAVGVTPVSVPLAPASYAVRVGDGARRRDFTVNVLAGTAVLHHLEFPPVAVPRADEGSLHVQTEPSGQFVVVDDVPRGPSPITIEALSVGDHRVMVRGPQGPVQRTVAVRTGETVSLVFSPAPPALPAPGWLTVRAPSPLEIRQGGKLLGSTETEPLMLPAGAHDIELVSAAIGYRDQQRIEILSGKTLTIDVELPLSTLSINALPWAEVWIGGQRVGETPIANFPQRIGSHEVLFRHPQLGERTETVLVTLDRPARLGVDMRGR